MTALVASLLLTATIDGQAALRHASALSALGPHKWGSPLTKAAADYVEAQFRDAGLDEVRQQDFASHGLEGHNVIGVLRAAGPEFVLVGAHHDTAPQAPGAYDDGGGVGVMIEAARVLAKAGAQPRTLVFVSFDGEEAWSTGKTTVAGSRAYIQKLGSESRHLVAAFVIEMSGYERGTPVLHPIPYADPLRPGRYGVTPAWLMRAVLAGSLAAGAPLGVGDARIPWHYQAGVRSFRAGLYGDDLAFVQAGLPAVFVSDSSFSAFYPWYHEPADTKDKLSAAALERMGKSVLGALGALVRVPVGEASEPHWFAAFGRVFGVFWLWALGVLAIAPGLAMAWRAKGPPLALRLLQAAAMGALLWRHPVPAVFVLALPTLLSAFAPRIVVALLGLLPGLSLLVLAGLAYQRDLARSLWFRPWELALLVAALAPLFVGVSAPGRAGRRRAAAAPKRRRALGK